MATTSGVPPTRPIEGESNLQPAAPKKVGTIPDSGKPISSGPPAAPAALRTAQQVIQLVSEGLPPQASPTPAAPADQRMPLPPLPHAAAASGPASLAPATQISTPATSTSAIAAKLAPERAKKPITLGLSERTMIKFASPDRIKNYLIEKLTMKGKQISPELDRDIGAFAVRVKEYKAKDSTLKTLGDFEKGFLDLINALPLAAPAKQEVHNWLIRQLNKR